MTSKFSIDNRELLQRISSGEAVVGIDFGNLIVRELAAFRLAAMDSESGYLPLDYLQGHKDGLEWAAQLAEANHPETGDWLYDDPIELAKAIRKGPDMPPAQPVADSEPVAVIDLANLDYLLSGADADVWPPEREEMGDVLLYRHAQPAPVVPDEIKHRIGGLDWGWEGEFNRGWNACRAAMLAAAPQSPGSEPATVLGKWIPVSEQNPDCWCLTCRPVTLNDMRFVVCPDCGNKRCPRANDHRNACTGSNEPGQEGSAYPDTPREVK
ncbi:DUF551 domain-containing protein [Klebsiella pneumoniae]|uniref:DUF551 domain-containing protein n=1 Tax=Klebsiella pneumoniae TaxID=573 RepID=UPI002A0A6A5B|nr:DUF551 domain-containing protein [Klebsiella pneumoniae]